jgi:hypothetical protein
MDKIIRYILAVVVGFLTFGVVVYFGEMIGHRIYPLPPNLDPEHPEALNVSMQKVATGALVAVIIAWALGAFAGAWVAARLAPQRKLAIGLAIGAIGIAAAVRYMLLIPHPTWMWVMGIAEFVPAAYLGAKLAIPGGLSRAPVY